MAWRGIAAAVAAAALLSGCGATAPDYESIWTSTTASTPPKKPIALFLEDEGVSGVPMTPPIMTEMIVSIPTPPGWASVTDNAIPSAYTLLRRTPPAPPGGYTPQALLMVFKLSGDFDVAEAISHGFADAEISDQFTRVAASTDDVAGYPAATIQGTYVAGRQRLQSYNRLVIPTAPSGQRFLVQLTITTAADQAAAEGPAIDSIISGFRIAEP